MRIYVFLWWAFSLLSGTCFAQIQGKVYQDGNASGNQDAFEAGIAGIRIAAFNAQSQLIDQTRTDGQGWYTLSVTVGQAVSLRFLDVPKGLSPSKASLLNRFLTAPAPPVPSVRPKDATWNER
ncbi:SdrD B-like domain-containing protein [Siphonobacter sp. SORGH_AS_0500]|uniref:SdrD B-like domain-containing protein n=1 Tax=Siphonobacter sp. SORGH_AS_0500 TaxID=1864824 RepID=UPI000CA9772B|nr:SdrD B-like domain-containing protein [Siphonobacter sp. SORGH_AS_0500]MDR6193725.1 hypothetical protein [Siphonobacter sp. SORGH_AS_0500]PKK37908.1 hypothetical protein BWI96_02100 [Siphonobacter sp. SORGH_AS_0500]